MDDLAAGIVIGAILASVLWGIFVATLPLGVQAEVCTLAFSHAESASDSLAVLRTYDYCEVDDGE